MEWGLSHSPGKRGSMLASKASGMGSIPVLGNRFFFHRWLHSALMLKVGGYNCSYERKCHTFVAAYLVKPPVVYMAGQNILRACFEVVPCVGPIGISRVYEDSPSCLHESHVRWQLPTASPPHSSARGRLTVRALLISPGRRALPPLA